MILVQHPQPDWFQLCEAEEEQQAPGRPSGKARVEPPAGRDILSPAPAGSSGELRQGGAHSRAQGGFSGQGCCPGTWKPVFTAQEKLRVLSSQEALGSHVL